jgi:hypothetical protein
MEVQGKEREREEFKGGWGALNLSLSFVPLFQGLCAVFELNVNREKRRLLKLQEISFINNWEWPSSHMPLCLFR